MFSWIPVAGFQANIGILLDPLSISFVLLITGVGSLILIYAVGYMAHDAERRRFFGFLNLFIAAMLLLVISDNYLVLYAGWEGVGLASYLLIGFWQFKNTAAVAAKKAFIANRVGDVGLSLAIMLMFAEFGTFNFPGVFSIGHRAGPAWPRRSGCCCCSARAASPPRCRSSPGCSTRWRARRLCRPLFMRRQWSRLAFT